MDPAAGLPEGSCSAYLRTRRALRAALAQYVVGNLAADVEALGRELDDCSGHEERATGLALSLFQRWLDERDLLLARLELSMEASRDPELADLLAMHRNQLITVVDRILAERGKGHGIDRAETLVASFDGILAAALLKPATTRGPFVSGSVALLMGSLAGE